MRKRQLNVRLNTTTTLTPTGLEIDDASIKWIDSDANVVRIPVATINCLLLGPGTSVTHEAVKIASSANCSIFWVGEDSLIFYAAGQTPTSNTRNLKMQMKLACDNKKALTVIRRMYAYRFPELDLQNKSLSEMRGLEGRRVRELYQKKAEEYNVGWKGRSYTPNKFELSDITNKILTSTNAALYGIITSIVHSLGFSPHIGFIHSGSPLPFVYDLADLYKDEVSIDLAFALTLEMAGNYNKHTVAHRFRERVLQINLLSKASKDIQYILTGEY